MCGRADPVEVELNKPVEVGNVLFVLRTTTGSRRRLRGRSLANVEVPWVEQLGGVTGTEISAVSGDTSRSVGPLEPTIFFASTGRAPAMWQLSTCRAAS